MSVWWDKDKSDRVKGIRCNLCVTHPELVQTGYPDPQSLKCPVCKTEYNSQGDVYDEEEYNAHLRRELEESVEDAWNAIWGQS